MFKSQSSRAATAFALLMLGAATLFVHCFGWVEGLAGIAFVLVTFVIALTTISWICSGE